MVLLKFGSRQRDNIDAFYHVVASRFSKSAGVHPEWARWAVNVWSEVLSDVPKAQANKPVNFGKTLREMNAEINNPQNRDPQLEFLRGGSPIWLKLFMTLIVVAGGFSGAFIGVKLADRRDGIGLGYGRPDDGEIGTRKMFPSQQRMSGLQKAFAYTIFFLLYSTPTAIFGALGSAAGWWFGRADGRPWLGFFVCFAAACGANTVLVFVGCLPTLAVTFFVCFTASFKAASTTT